jgi:hypothetical protein
MKLSVPWCTLLGVLGRTPLTKLTNEFVGFSMVGGFAETSEAAMFR